MYTLMFKKFGEDEPTRVNVPSKEIACEIGFNIAEQNSNDCEIEILIITLDQPNRYVKSQMIYLMYGFDINDLDKPYFKHSLEVFDWRNS